VRSIAGHVRLIAMRSILLLARVSASALLPWLGSLIALAELQLFPTFVLYAQYFHKRFLFFQRPIKHRKNKKEIK
jgi:hypothetical protein